jgi:N-methylhydantoinase A
MVHIGIDVGGTFTDLFALDPERGSIVAEKADTTADGISGVLAALAHAGIAPHTVESLVLGATTATNALVQRRIDLVAFLGTDGFTDTLEIRLALGAAGLACAA